MNNKPCADLCKLIGVTPDEVEAFESDTCKDCVFCGLSCGVGLGNCWPKISWRIKGLITKVEDISKGVERGVVEFQAPGETKWSLARCRNLDSIFRLIKSGGKYRWTAKFRDEVDKISEGIKQGIVEFEGDPAIFEDRHIIRSNLLNGKVYKFVGLTDVEDIKRGIDAGAVEVFGSLEIWTDAINPYPCSTIQENLDAGFLYRVKHGGKIPEKKKWYMGVDWGTKPHVVDWYTELRKRCEDERYAEQRDRTEEELDLLVGAYKYRDKGGGQSHLFVASRFPQNQSLIEIAKVGTNNWEPMQKWV